MRDALQDTIHSGLISAATQFFQTMSNGPAAAVASNGQADSVNSDLLRWKREIGLRILEQTILVNSRFGREYVLTTDRLVRCQRDASELSNKLRQRDQLIEMQPVAATILVLMQ